MQGGGGPDSGRHQVFGANVQARRAGRWLPGQSGVGWGGRKGVRAYTSRRDSIYSRSFVLLSLPAYPHRSWPVSETVVDSRKVPRNHVNRPSTPRWRLQARVYIPEMGLFLYTSSVEGRPLFRAYSCLLLLMPT